MSLNRIGGVTIYGFLRDNHGGVEAAQELCRYATERGVRILPGVGINAYGGIYWEGDHKYNLTTWLRQHPELRAVLEKRPAFHIPDFPELWFPDSQYTTRPVPQNPKTLAITKRPSTGWQKHSRLVASILRPAIMVSAIAPIVWPDALRMKPGHSRIWQCFIHASSQRRNKVGKIYG